jgi:hypothetical protein
MDYKHANHLCFKCGEIFDANRKCGKKWNAELHLVHTENMPEATSDEMTWLKLNNSVYQFMQWHARIKLKLCD